MKCQTIPIPLATGRSIGFPGRVPAKPLQPAAPRRYHQCSGSLHLLQKAMRSCASSFW